MLVLVSAWVLGNLDTSRMVTEGTEGHKIVSRASASTFGTLNFRGRTASEIG